MSITESERAYRQRSEVKKRNSEWFAKYYAENKERLNRKNYS